MDRAKRLRQAHKNLLDQAITDLKQELQGPEAQDKVIEVEASIENLSAIWKDYERSTGEVQRLEDDAAQLGSILSEAATTRKSYLKAKREAEVYLQSRQPVTRAQTPVTTSTHPAQRVRLPELKLPTFSGSVSQWPTFWSGFAVIDENPDLTGDSKLRHLISCLSGTAAKDLEGLRIVEDNYALAVKLLKERYGRDDLILADHIEKLQNLPSVKCASDVEALRKLYSELEIHLRGLKDLNKSKFSDMLGPILFQKLPSELRLIWTTDAKHELTDLTGMVDMLKLQVEARERSISFAAVQSVANKPAPKVDGKPRSSTPVATAAALVGSTKVRKCPFCDSESHNSFHCTLSVAGKKKAVFSKGLCFNCLGPGHGVDACRSLNKCKTCRGSHHTSLHQEQSGTREGPSSGPRAEPGTRTVSGTASISSSVGVLAATSSADQESHSTSPSVGMDAEATTVAVAAASGSSVSSKLILIRAAVAWVNGVNGPTKIRCLFDSGCQRTIIKASTALELGLSSCGSEMSRLYGLGGPGALKKRPAYRLLLHPKSIRGEPVLDISTSAYAIAEESIGVPVPKVPPGEWLRVFEERSHVLADDLANEVTHDKIDLLIGADLYSDLVYEDQCFRLDNGVLATNTFLGWTLLGPLDQPGMPVVASVCAASAVVSTATQEENLLTQLKEQWSLESIGISSKEQQAVPVEKHPVYQEFAKTATFDGERYIVQLPKKPTADFHDSGLALAKRRLLLQLYRFRANPQRLREYDSIFKEHLQQGFLEEVPANEIANFNNPVRYLSHLAVVRMDKPTTPVRIVFDGSAAEPGSNSLNDELEVGPNTQEDLLRINLLFRLHPVALVADVSKAFLRIGLDNKDRNLVRCLWVDDPFKPNPLVKHYRYRRVIFGLNCSPFLLGAVFKLHLSKLDADRPAVKALRENRYVDDLATGAATTEAAWDLANEAIQICDAAGFPLSKFQTNCANLRQRLRSIQSNVIPEQATEPDESDIHKLFGLRWNTRDDMLEFELDPILEHIRETGHICTKRNVLRTSLMLYDRMGLISPISIVPSIIVQRCWTEGITWDQTLSNSLKSSWESWCRELQDLRNFSIHRRLFESASSDVTFTLHVFCDASESAYGVTAYLVSEQSSNLITSRAKVAPIKKLTLARLELLAMVIGARLLKYLTNVFSFLNLSSFLWSDSRVAICWAQSPVFQLKTWVANRVQEIQDLVDPARIVHCPGVENPGDMCSRGTTASFLLSSSLWWHGPLWLKEWRPNPAENVGPASLGEEERTTLHGEQRSRAGNISVAAVSVDSSFSLWCERFSSLSQLLRVTAWIQRFVSNRKVPVADRKGGPLSVDEIRAAKVWWVRRVQSEVFQEDMMRLKQGMKPPRHSVLTGCCGIYLDQNDNLIKIKGRTQLAASLQNDVPVMPSEHPFVNLLIKDAHERLAHGWVRDTFNQLSYHIWILRGRQRVKSVLSRCMVCKRLMGRPIQQPTGQLPATRCNIGDPFETTGLDYFGPLFIKSSSNVPEKRYACLFVCARTRAIHLELVQDMSVSKFLLALERFVARRGLCRQLISDNARTFHRADRVLQSAWKDLRAANQQITDQLSQRGIEWSFIPERAPWWGGFWERLVQSVKIPLRKMIGKSVLREDELVTVLVQVEAAVNSRPLTFISSDQRDPEPLSPFTILTGKRNHHLPPLNEKRPPPANVSAEDLQGKLSDRRDLADAFWNIWSKEYLLILRQYKQRAGRAREVRVGEVVLVKADNLPRLCWKMGRIIEVYRSRIDGVIRAALVRTATGMLRRAVDCLIPLEVEGADHPCSSSPQSSPAAAPSTSKSSTSSPSEFSSPPPNSPETESAGSDSSNSGLSSDSDVSFFNASLPDPNLAGSPEPSQPTVTEEGRMRVEAALPSHGGGGCRIPDEERSSVAAQPPVLRFRRVH